MTSRVLLQIQRSEKVSDIYEKMLKYPAPKPYRSTRQVVEQWVSRAKSPELGNEDDSLLVFKYADGMGDVFIRDGETGEIRLTYGGSSGLPFDDEIAWAINSDFNVESVPQERWSIPQERLLVNRFRAVPKNPDVPVYHHLYAYSDGSGAFEVIDREEHHTMEPPGGDAPMQTFESYFDTNEWECTRMM